MNRCRVRRSWRQMTKTATCGCKRELKGLQPLVMERDWMDQAGAGFPGSARGFLLKGNTSLYQAGKVEQSPDTGRIISQRQAEPISLRQRLTLEFHGTLKLSGFHSFVLFKSGSPSVLAFVRD